MEQYLKIMSLSLVFTLLFLFQYSASLVLNEPLLEEGSITSSEAATTPHNADRFTENNENSETEHVIPVDFKSCKLCVCGLSGNDIDVLAVLSTTNLIAGGSIVQSLSEYPWIAQFYRNNQFFCSGSLINSKYILTAAHCVVNLDKSDILIRLLEHEIVEMGNSVLERNVSKIIVHKEFDGYTNNNDIALLRLDEDIELDNSRLIPVCLPLQDETYANLNGTVIGWGKTKFTGTFSRSLREVTIPIMSNEECINKAHRRWKINDNMMCAGIWKGGKDACEGDSGGPLHFKNGSIHHLVGIVSYGEACAQKYHPGVYARVNKHLDWIRKHTADACSCVAPKI